MDSQTFYGVISTAMSSRKQGTVFWACKVSSLKCWNKQLYTSVCLPGATRQEKLLPRAKAPGCLTTLQHSWEDPASLGVPTSGQAPKCREGKESSAAGRNSTAEPIHWGKDCGRRTEVVGTPVSGVVIKKPWDWACGEMKSRMWIFSGLTARGWGAAAGAGTCSCKLCNHTVTTKQFIRHTNRRKQVFHFTSKYRSRILDKKENAF